MSNESLKHAYRLVPCPAYDVEGVESWLTDLASEGLLLAKDGFFCGVATFERTQPQPVKYRLEAAPKSTSMWSNDGGEPDDEAVALSEQLGWEYIASYGEFYVFRSSDPTARELNTDPDVQALALNAVRKRRRGFAFVLFFEAIFWLCCRLYNNWLLATITLGTVFSLFTVALLLLFLSGSIIELVHLTRLHRQLRVSGCINHHKDWKPNAFRYHFRRVLEAVLLLLWICILLSKWSASITEKNEVDLRDYTGEPPFATLIDLVGDDSSEYHLSTFGIANTPLEWSDLLAPRNIEWDEIAEITRADGTTFDGALYIKYHETVHPWLARQLAYEYLSTDRYRFLKRKNSSFQYHGELELAVDYAIYYTDPLHLPTVILQNGCKVIQISLRDYSNSVALAPEEWARLAAKYLK